MPAKRPRKASRGRRLLVGLLLGLAALFAAFSASLFALRWIDPPFTALHAQRRLESWFSEGAYRKRFTLVPMRQISPHFRRAVVAAEDSRFYQHHGIDWEEVESAIAKERRRGGMRGASTITQQLIKNLYFGTRGTLVRKPVEVVLAPVADVLLGKERILELYLNVVEWGPGVYGAEEAARFWYGVSAAGIGREQGARLAAILPAPLRRKPARMDNYSAEILSRMERMGW